MKETIDARRVRGLRAVVAIAEEGKGRTGTDAIKQSLNRIGGNEARVSASVGVAMYPQDGTTLQQLVTCADMALYTAKANGKGAYHFPGHTCEQHAA